MPDVVVPAKPKPVTVPLDLQAASKVIEQHKTKDDDEILAALIRTAGTISEAATNVQVAHDRIIANEMATPMANLAAARKRVREIHDAETAKLADLRAKLAKKVDELEATTLPHAAKDVIGAVAAIEGAEVRTALRAMKADQRLKVVREAVEAGDASFVAAVINGGSSHLLTGMGRAEVLVARDMWQRKHHPDTLARVTRLKAAQAQLDRLGTLFTSWSASIYAEKDAAIAAAERSAELAAKAMAASG